MTTFDIIGTVVQANVRIVHVKLGISPAIESLDVYVIFGTGGAPLADNVACTHLAVDVYSDLWPTTFCS